MAFILFIILLHMVVSKKEAVLILAPALPNPSSCPGRLLYHVASTAGMKRDVWLLVNAKGKKVLSKVLLPPDAVQNSTVDVSINLDLQSNFVPDYNDNDGWNMFSAKKGRSKGAKNIMVMWMSAHAHQYDFVWHIEPDLLYTGARWDEVFEFNRLDNDMADVVARIFLHHDNKWIHGLAKRCRIGKEDCRVWIVSGAGTSLVLAQTFFPLLRISTHFALEIKRALDADEFYGHHEATLYAMCRKKSLCTWSSTVPFMDRGITTWGGWGALSFTNYTLTDLLKFGKQDIVAQNALYHPVKTGCFENHGMSNGVVSLGY